LGHFVVICPGSGVILDVQLGFMHLTWP